jgi:drug/metabolite transporter (DMT)-like permease
VTIGLGLFSAFAFACAVVFQQRAALDVPVVGAARPSLLIRLARRPIWLLGLGADMIGFALQTLALHRGSLVVVQPIIATSLLFTLGLIALTDHQLMSLGRWAAVGVVIFGLSVFLAVGSPRESATADAGLEGWMLCALMVCAVVGLAVTAGVRARGPARAGWFGLAAGVCEASMAVLAKAFADSFGHGPARTFLSWTPYALVAGGVTCLVLVSTAYQAGHPTRSLPIMTVADPLVGCVIGMALFGERLRLEGLRGPLVALAVLLMGTGLFTLGRDARLAARIGGDHTAGSGRLAEMA